MPTYEYVCKKCHHRFESFQSIALQPLKVCPACEGPLERIIFGGSGLIFKGSGFYITDYKNKSDGSSKSTTKTKVEKKVEKVSEKTEKKTD